MLETLAGPGKRQARRRADDHLHLRLDRHTQGRDADLRQHRQQRRSDRPGRPSPRDRRARRHPAVLPFVRLHGDDVGRRQLSISAAPITTARSTPGKSASSSPSKKARCCSRRPHSSAAYLRRCEPEEMKTLEVVVCGAEKLPKELADEFEKKFGVRPVEGYGTTELSPLASVNMPPSRSHRQFQADRKEGSVGRPVPGVTAKVTDLETGEELPAGQARHALDRRPQRDEGLSPPARKDGRGDQGRLVQDGRRRLHRRGRLHSHHRPPKPLLKNRRRDGAAHSASRKSWKKSPGPPPTASLTSPSPPCPTKRKANG